MRHTASIILTAFVLVAMSCDGGLAPPDVDPGIDGVITVVSTTPWPPASEVVGLWLFASLEYPIDSARIFDGLLVEPRTIFLYPSIGESLPYGVDSVTFHFPLAPGTYRYVGVMQQVRPEFLVSSFRVVAMLEDTLAAGTPRTVIVGPGDPVQGIRLRLDFGSLPPQPFSVSP